MNRFIFETTIDINNAFIKVFLHLPDSDKHFYECIIDINGCFKNETIHLMVLLYS